MKLEYYKQMQDRLDVGGTLSNVMAEDLLAEIVALQVALHDAINRPMGVVPDSALEFYDPNFSVIAPTNPIMREPVI